MGGSGRGRGRYGRGDGSGGNLDNSIDPNAARPGGNNGGTFGDLINTLYRVDGQSYPAYRDIESSSRGWTSSSSSSVDAASFSLYVGRAQADPFARPTRCRIVVPSSYAQFPAESYSTKIRAIALSDYLNRALSAACIGLGADQAAGGGGWSGAKGGDIRIEAPGQNVLEQSAVVVDASGNVTVQFAINLPARGRTIQGDRAVEIFERTLPTLVKQTLRYSSLNSTKMQHHILSVEDQEWLRNQLEASGLVAFVANGAVLPRASGADDKPMVGSGIVRFESPPQLRMSFVLPNLQKTIEGMGIRKGVTLIVGGGFHGKSTLLSALQVGVYNKIPGDGREFCVADVRAVKVRAEDGRAVSSVDISPFINNLPFGQGTTCFSTEDASGSTSQASNIVEALEVGASTLLVDEDTCATNFMIRDDKMMELVSRDKEPITPFIHKIRSLYEDNGVSSVLVIGGSGDYFDVADCVIMMDSYTCLDVTARAKQIALAAAEKAASAHVASSSQRFGSIFARCPIGSAYKPNNKVSVRARSVISYGDIELELGGLEQIVSMSQTNSISMALQRIAEMAISSMTLSEVLAQLDVLIDSDGLDALAPGHFNGNLARPRLFEVAAAVNRLRKTGNMVQKK